MHPILIKVQRYLADVAAGRAEPITKELLFDFSKRNVENLTRTFGDKPDKFRLRMSNVGRPTCQLQMEQSNAPAEEAPYYSKFRDTYGDLTESLAVLVLKASGVNVVTQQQRVALDIAGERISGTLDLTIAADDGVERVWDLKSASHWTFVHKFESFDSVVKDDNFGYVAQLVGYSQAVKKPIGGWIVVDKETGEWTVISAPAFVDPIVSGAMEKIEHNIRSIVDNVPFKRSFEDIEEKFRRKKTGNRILGTACSYCRFKHACWNNLQYRNSIFSESEHPKKVWYTEITKEKESETKS